MNVASLKKWNVLLPEFTKLGKNKLVKFYPPVLIGIEFVATGLEKENIVHIYLLKVL